MIRKPRLSWLSTLLEAIQNAFNTTFDSDKAIAQKLNSRGLQTTPNQVQEIRLKHGWRRQAANAEQLEAQRTETFAREMAPVTTKLVLATKTSSKSGLIAPTTFLTSFVQEFPGSISLPTEFRDQVPASQVQQQGKGNDQYSLALGQLIVAVLVLIGVGKVVEHLGKKAWNAIGTCCSRYSFHFFKCLRNLMKPSISFLLPL